MCPALASRCSRYPNGARYEGTWLDNLKHGHGVYTFPKVVPCLANVCSHTVLVTVTLRASLPYVRGRAMRARHSWRLHYLSCSIQSMLHNRY